MKTSGLWILLGLLFVASPPPATAQLAEPGSGGITMGHVHLVVRDLDAQRQFWSALGGVPTKNGTLEMYQFPGVFILLRKGEPAGGSIGSSVNHIGFTVKNVAEWVAKWQAAGIHMEPQTRPTQVYLVAPDDVRVEILEEAAQSTPVRFHHVHFALSDQLAGQAWYAKVFGAVPGKRAQFDAADLPGVNLTFTRDDKPVAKSMGRAIDHIGFEVKGLPAFVAKLQSMGITLDRPLQQSASAPTISTAFFTDPWGTQIELTENLAPSAAPASAQAPLPAGAGLQAFVGKWALNPAKTRMGVNGPATPTPLRDPTFTWIFTGTRDGLQMDVFEKYPLPAPTRTLQINPDGVTRPCATVKPCLPSGGDPREQSYAYHKLDDHMISRLFYVKGQIAEYDSYSISEDGKTLVIIAWHAPTPEYQNVQVFDRQP